MRFVISFSLVFVSIFALSFFVTKHLYFNRDKKVLGMYVFAPTSTLTPTPTPSPSPTPSLTPTPTLIPTQIPPSSTPTSIPFPTRVPQPSYTSEQIHGFIERFAGQYAVDPNILRHIAICESGFRADAINGPYGGLYQYSVSTWNTSRAIIGEDPNPDLRFNAEEAVQTTAYLIALGKGHHWPGCMP